MFAFPVFLLARRDTSPGTCYDLLEVATWMFAIAGLVLSYYAAVALRPARPARAPRGTRRCARPRTGGGVSVKAVILAGGEGTRLRPLTSNQPKPMMPLVNRPMMEHIVALLARHGFDDIVVTVAFLANQIRDYFGDGSDFGVRMRYATEDTPLGTAGSVRNASAELDDTFLVISGDVLTDIDLSAFVKAHRDERRARRRSRSKRVENPLEFGIVITRPDGSIERFLEKPTWGQVFSDTINTGIYVLEPAGLRLHPRGRGRRLLRRRVPGGARRRGSRSTATSPTATGRTSARSRRTSAPTPTCSTVVSRSTSPGFELGDGIWLGEGAEIDPDARIEGPVVIGDNCRIEAGARLRRVHRARHRRRREGRRVPRAHASATTTSTSGADAACAGCVIGRVHRPARPRPGRGRRRGRRRVLRRRARGHQPGREGLPVQDGRGRRGRQLVDRVGEPRRAHAVRPARRPRARQRRHHARGRGPGRDGVRHRAARRASVVTTSRDTSRVARALKRAIIGGLNLAGVNVEDVELATVPLTRFQVRNGDVAGRHHRAARARRPRQRRDPLLRRRRPRHRRRRRSARSSGCSTARTSGARSRATSATSCSRPARSSSTPRRSSARSTSTACANARFKVVLDYSFGAASIVMPTVLAKLGAEVLAVNPFASTAPASTVGRPTAHGRAHRRARARVGERPRLRASTPTARRSTSSTTTGHVLVARPRRCSRSCASSPRRSEHARIALPVSRHAGGRAARRRARRGDRVDEAGPTRSLMEVASARHGRRSRRRRRRVHLARLPARLRRPATLAKLLDLLAGDRPIAVVGRARRCRAVHLAHETVADAVGAQGRGDARDGRAGRAEREVVLIDGVKVVATDGWALVLPDPEEPLTHVWAEAGSDHEARQLAQEYARAHPPGSVR